MAETTKTVANLFEPEPFQWGLRGDPYLWREMAQLFQGVALPASPTQLEMELERAFESLTQQPFSSGGSIYLERYSQGGMSSGHISTEFWQQKAIPLLLSRFIDQQGIASAPFLP